MGLGSSRFRSAEISAVRERLVNEGRARPAVRRLAEGRASVSGDRAFARGPITRIPAGIDVSRAPVRLRFRPALAAMV
ncbi:hypothetical protein B5V46_13970 [Rhodovulum sp. MB263]|nr:hypothetical protein B5V46_13970 [Rhodovulum sp. MB263]